MRLLINDSCLTDSVNTYNPNDMPPGAVINFLRLDDDRECLATIRNKEEHMIAPTFASLCTPYETLIIQVSIRNPIWKFWNEDTVRAVEVFLLNAFSLDDLVIRLERCALLRDTKCNEEIIWTCQLIDEEDIISYEDEIELLE